MSSRISDLTADTAPQPTDLAVVVDSIGVSNKKVQVSQLAAMLLAPTGSHTVSAGYSEIAVRSYTIASGTKLTLGLGARFRIL